MSAGGPRLVRLDEPAKPAAAPAVAGSPHGRWVLPLALAAALVAAAAWGFETRRAGALEVRVGELSQALRAAEAQVAAHRRHLDEIRGGVAGVRERLDALQELAAKDPARPAAPSTAPDSEVR